MSGMRGVMNSLGGMLATCLWMAAASAQSVPFEEVRTLSRGPEPVVRTLEVAAAGTYRLTLTDLAVPAAFISLQAAITRGNSVVATLAAPGSVDFTASEAASYTLRVVGVPASAAGAGSFGASVVNTTAGNAVILEFAEAINNPPPVVPPNRSTLDTTFEVTEAGEHEVALIDNAFPAALPTLTLAILRDGAPALAAQLAAPGTTNFVATPGRYRLLVIGESAPATNAGAFGVRIRASASQAVVYSRSEPVGRVKQLELPPLQAGAHQLTLSDLAFPVPLANNAALLTLGADAVARRNAPGTVTFTAAAGEHQLLVLAAASASLPGSYGIELRRDPNTRVFSTVLTAPAASGSVTGVQAFNYVVDVPTAGAYRLRLADFQFPQAFVSSGIAATQSGTLLGSLDAPGTLTLDVVEAGNLFVVALAQPAATATPSGLLGLDVVSTTAGATPVFERTEGVGALFAARSISIAAAGEYDATVTDLQFPAQFAELAAVVTRGAERLGSVFAGGTFPFAAQPGSYIVSVIAQPSQAAVYGTYGLRVAARPPAPVLTLSADATSIPNGGTVMLTWTTNNTTACTASGGWSGSRATSGSERTAAITASTTFTLNCNGPGGQSSASVSITPTSAGGGSGGQGGGGGRIDVLLLVLLAAVLIAARSQRRAPHRAYRLGVLLAAGSLMPAGATWANEKVAAAAVLPSSTGQTSDDRAYRIQPGDVLVVAVWKERDLQGDILVRPDGGITFPLAGDIAAGGNTVVQLGDALAAKLKRYIPDPVVTVAVKSIGGNRVYVLGKVNRPGEFAFSQPLDVMQALALAGGATPFAAVNDIRILRRSDNRLVAVEFQYAEVERGRRLEQNIVLRSGDTVVVP